MGKLSNFPNGFANGVTIRGLPLCQMHPGKVFYVNNSGVQLPNSLGKSDANEGSLLKPFATIDYAIGQCVAGRGDIICVAPGHAETLSAASAITVDVAGICILGLGVGNARPTLTYDTAATTSVVVSAANCSIKNIKFVPNYADITTVFDVTTAKYLTIEDCFIGDGATNMNFLNVVDTNTTTAACDGLALINNVWIEPDLATLSLIKMDGTNANCVVECNYVNLGVNDNKSALMTIANGKIVTSLYMVKNRVYRLNTDTATGAILLHTNGSTLTGIVSENFAQHADSGSELLITASSGLGCFNNYNSGVAGASGYLLPAADS